MYTDSVLCAVALCSALSSSTAAAYTLRRVELPTNRQFLVVWPQAPQPPQPNKTAAVMLLHGFGENPYSILSYTGIVPKLLSKGWFGIVPFGLAPNSTFNAGVGACCDPGCGIQNVSDPAGVSCCEGIAKPKNPSSNATAWECDWNVDRTAGGANDTQFLTHVAEWAATNLPGLDPARIYATGMSAGAMMVERLGCDAPGPFAALAPVEGDLMDDSTCDPAPTKPVPWLGFCGSLDFVCQVMGTTFSKTVKGWAVRNGCDMSKAPSTSMKTNTTECRTYHGCTEGVQACNVRGMPHEWPGHPAPGQKPQKPGNIDATQYILEFFANGSSHSSSSSKLYPE